MVAARLCWCVLAMACCLGLPETVSAKTVFLGSSQTAGWKYVGGFKNVVNKAVVSNTTAKILRSLGPVVRLKPEKVFILEGINEISGSTATILGRYREILRRIHRGSPATRIFVQSVLPVRNRPDLSNRKIMELNAGLQSLCDECANCVYVDLYRHFVEDGQMRRQLTSDGVHLRPDGYRLWRSLLAPYLAASNDRPAKPDVVARLGQPSP